MGKVALVAILAGIAVADDARSVAKKGLVAQNALAFAEEFFEKPDPELLAGLVAILEKGPAAGADARGAYWMLLTLSGKHLPPDAALWRGYAAAASTRYHRPPNVNDGNVAAAALRGAHFLRRRLETRGGVEAGGMGGGAPPRYSVALSCLAVVALRAAGDRDKDGLLAGVVDTAYAALERRNNTRLGHWMERDDAFHLALLLLAMEPKTDAKRMAKLTRRLVSAQLRTGKWGGEPPVFSPATLLAMLALRHAERAGIDVPSRV